MNLKQVNDKLYFALYLQCKALEFEVNSSLVTPVDRVKYFIGCRVYEVLIQLFLVNLRIN